MPVQLHVTGTVRYGYLPRFVEAAKLFIEYRKKMGYCVPRIYIGLSGAMNTILKIFEYSSATEWEREEAIVNADPKYSHIASEMPYIEGSIHYDLFQPIEVSTESDPQLGKE